ncbi:hypothetical protein, partial [Streptomyces sp. SID5770]|uniref:hypothetical protein n=1 Tax=Streptomyces sp. SID5770 TaxID=2690308 RepID=UPI001F22F96E
AVAQLPPEEEGFRRSLEATVVAVAILEPARSSLSDRIDQLRKLPRNDTVGGKRLDSVLAFYETSRGDRAGIDRAAW